MDGTNIRQASISKNPSMERIMFATTQNAVLQKPFQEPPTENQTVLSRNKRLKEKLAKLAEIYNTQTSTPLNKPDAGLTTTKKAALKIGNSRSILIPADDLLSKPTHGSVIANIFATSRKPGIKLANPLLKAMRASSRDLGIIKDCATTPISKGATTTAALPVKLKLKIAQANCSNSTAANSELKSERADRYAKRIQEELNSVKEKTRKLVERFIKREKILIIENQKLKGNVKDLKVALSKYEAIV